ncbi:MAG: transposase [Planctomycetes bacterium]|nr:transposase [Planctomycetota bacterium]
MNRDYLTKVRWTEGFKCPKCECSRAWVNVRHLLVCS